MAIRGTHVALIYHSNALNAEISIGTNNGLIKSRRFYAKKHHGDFYNTGGSV